MPRPVKKPTVYEELTYQLIGIALEIHKELGSVHKESVYHNAFCKELTSCSIPFKSEVYLPVKYREKKVGIYKPDVLVDDKVIIEIKAVEFLPVEALTQLCYYLKGTNYRVGLLLNFGSPRLQIRRRIYGY